MSLRLLTLLLALVGVSVSEAVKPHNGQAERLPNFVFILGEAQGWAALSTQMDRHNPRSKSEFFYTPNLAKVAEQGMRFSQFYAPSPRCTPSRVTYLTGISPAALRMTFVSTADSGGRVIMSDSGTEMPESVTTIAERLKAVGYSTAHFGKWHVGKSSPARHGFDEHDGANSNSGPENSKHPNPKQFYGTVTKGIDFMTRSVQTGRPFYLQISHYGGKSALDCKPETMALLKQRVGNRNLAQLGAAAVALDADLSTGQLLDAMDKLGITDNTYFFYTTDHGTAGRNGPLANGKGSVSEGGIRVPLIFRGPGIKPGSYADMLTSGADLFPTIADLAGVTAPHPQALEGGSLKNVLLNAGRGTVRRSREEFVVHFPHYDKDPLGPATSIHLGDHKLIHYYETGDRHLYNLKTDLGERRNLAAEMPAKTTELSRRLSAYLQEVKAELPRIDKTRPVGAGQAPRGGGGKPSGILTALDTDQDGKVTPAEMQNAAKVLMKFDRNGDGQLTEDEIRRGTRGGGGQNRNRDNRPQSSSQSRSPSGGNKPGYRMPTLAFRTDVPAHDYNVIIGRPTDTEVTLSLLTHKYLDIEIWYGPGSNHMSQMKRSSNLKAGQPHDIVVGELKPNTRYHYQINTREGGASSFSAGKIKSFQTARPPGSTFVFTVQADSHLDYGIVPELYANTLRNVVADQSDFHLALGDTFMVDKRNTYQEAALQYLAQRYYFGLLSDTTALYFVLGNHDGEFGYRPDMAAWSADQRLRHIPNPSPNNFYTGNPEPFEDYYAWQWGDAHFICLDPFRYTTIRKGGQWNKTLGERQYRWLQHTLETSSAKYKFIFLHYLIGGLNNETRGAKNIAHLYEWGGHNTDGIDEWTRQRPGWEMPIHDLCVKHGVNIVYHGHDHLYVKEELDGVIYQEVPQPGHQRFNNTRTATEYGYDGVTFGSSGHIRVTVSPDEVRSEYIWSLLPANESNQYRNGQVAHSYRVITPGKR